MGGTEILYKGLSENLDLSNFNLILSNCDEGLLSKDKPNIVWQHLDINEPATLGISQEFFHKKIDAAVFVSSWQYEKYLQRGMALDKAHVIRNAIYPIEYIEKPKDKIKLIYASTPYRGLDVLLDVFEKIEREDVELDIYSSTTIYGEGPLNSSRAKYEHLFDRARNMKNVNYHGQGSNEEVRAAMQKSHILAYPSIFRETSCLVAIEAGAAGCEIVSTQYGAIPETTAGFATLVTLPRSLSSLKERYKEALLYSIDNLDQEKLKRQSDYFNTMYSWESRLPEWERLFNKLSG